MPDHFALPFRVAGGRAVVLEQDTVPEITQCARVVLMTPLGARTEVPDFGLADQVFTRRGAAGACAAALATWEPRAAAVASELGVSPEDFALEVSVRIGGDG